QATEDVRDDRVEPVGVARRAVLVRWWVDQLQALAQRVDRAALPSEGEGVARRTTEESHLALAHTGVECVGEALPQCTEVLAHHRRVVLTGGERTFLAGQSDVAGREGDVGDAGGLGFLNDGGQ